MDSRLFTHTVSLSPNILAGSDAKVHDGDIQTRAKLCDGKLISTAPDEVERVTVSQPSRCFQAILLLSGFLMIFQVNGINSIFGVFQVSSSPFWIPWITLTVMSKEFYTSDKSNISEAQGQDALVSLVGAIGYGLTYGGSIFVSQLVMRVEKIKIVTICGAVITSLGLFLAGFCTKVCALPVYHMELICITLVALASVCYSRIAVWTWRDTPLLPYDLYFASILPSEPRLRNGLCPGRQRHWRVSSISNDASAHR